MDKAPPLDQSRMYKTLVYILYWPHSEVKCAVEEARERLKELGTADSPSRAADEDLVSMYEEVMGQGSSDEG